LSEALTEAPLTGDALVYAQILADMRDGVLTLDLAGQIITFNAAAGHFWGWTLRRSSAGPMPSCS
jgi:PAS domain-containing protein